ncbi:MULTISPECIES: hypothetical protein [unclassified Mycobacterium]|uniref:hypothetical protein n=1 Tax=unclassified Mycobacterium TaxID=2642494 RepID=UPI0009919762|nr:MULTISPECIES: hypothetical protein [unclassified Mycobacterium]
MGDVAEPEDTDDVTALPVRSEKIMSDARASWRALRDGGVITAEQGWEMVRQQWDDAQCPWDPRHPECGWAKNTSQDQMSGHQ